MITKNLQEFYLLLQSSKPIIAVDYGNKKIGVAISNQECTIAMPLYTINTVSNAEKISTIMHSVNNYLVCGIVIGLPVAMDGQVSHQAENVLKFVQELSKTTELPIYLQDERLTTKAANSFLKSFGMKRKQRNNKDDMVAASMILETTLDSLKRL